GDMDKAIELLREKGLAAVAKKSGRIAAEGIVHAEYDENKKVGAMVEVNSETDFVAKNETFRDFVIAVTKTVINDNPADLDSLMNCKLAGSTDTVEEALREKVLTIGENLKIRRFERYEGIMVSYIHGGGRIGVAVCFDTDDATAKKPEFQAYGRDVAMQVAAMNPSYFDKSSVTEADLAKERELFKSQVLNEGKPEAIADKIVEGKMGKFFKENCLMQQSFVKDNDISIEKYTQNVAKELDAKITVKSFTRFEKGEGLEKKQDNFADEVASMIK
ncbi:MAG: translation elongation factor Ts, partial [Oscillospiraceae bacterium]